MSFRIGKNQYLSLPRVAAVSLSIMILSLSVAYASSVSGNQNGSAAPAGTQAAGGSATSTIGNTVAKVGNTVSKVANTVSQYTPNALIDKGTALLGQTLSGQTSDFTKSYTNVAKSAASTGGSATGLTGGVGTFGYNQKFIGDARTVNTVMGTNNVALPPRLLNTMFDRILGGTKPTAGDLPPLIQKTAGEGGNVSATLDNAGRQWIEDYNANNLRTLHIFKNWIDPNHKLVDNAGQPGPLLPASKEGIEQTGTGSSTFGGNGNMMLVNMQGGARKFISTKYHTNMEALSDGACQMIKTGNGPYSFTPMIAGKKDLSYKMDGNTSGTSQIQNVSMITGARPSTAEPRGAAVSGDYEAILAPQHPFAPRNEPDWVGRVSPSIIEAIDAKEYNSKGASAGKQGQAAGGGNASSGSKSGGTFASLKAAGGKVNEAAQKIEALLYTYTYVSGHKKFKYALPIPDAACSIFTTGTKDSVKKSVKGMNFDFKSFMKPKEAWVDGFDYYKKPIQEHGAAILVNNTSNPENAVSTDKNRNEKFAVAMPICYYAIKYVCQYVTYDYAGLMCPKIALETCERTLSRCIILPPATPINRLKMAENLAPEGPSLAQQSGGGLPGGGAGGAAGGFAQTALSSSSSSGAQSAGKALGAAQSLSGAGQLGNGGQFLYEENRGGAQSICNQQLGNTPGLQFIDHGMSWYCSNPPTQFGYNMPPILHIESGQPVSNSVIAATGGTGKAAMEQWETWRTVIAGVNSLYLPDASNEMEAGSHNRSAQYGGWNELMNYQRNCMALKGLNCICDWQKNFADGHAIALMGALAGSSMTIDNEGNKVVDRTVNVPGYNGSTRNPPTIAERTNREALLSYKMYTKDGEYYMEPLLGLPVYDGQLWPGDVKMLHGMQKVYNGEILKYTQNSSSAPGVTRRPYQAIAVKHALPNGCFDGVSQNDMPSPYDDAFENRPNLFLTHERRICPMGSAGAAASSNSAPIPDDFTGAGIPLIAGRVPCTYGSMTECVEPEPEQWDGTCPNGCGDILPDIRPGRV